MLSLAKMMFQEWVGWSKGQPKPARHNASHKKVPSSGKLAARQGLTSIHRPYCGEIQYLGSAADGFFFTVPVGALTQSVHKER